MSTSSSSATSIGIDVNVPWPISARAQMIVTVLSVPTLTQALGIAPAAVALGGKAAAIGPLSGIIAQPTSRPPVKRPLPTTALVWMN